MRDDSCVVSTCCSLSTEHLIINTHWWGQRTPSLLLFSFQMTHLQGKLSKTQTRIVIGYLVRIRWHWKGNMETFKTLGPPEGRLSFAIVHPGILKFTCQTKSDDCLALRPARTQWLPHMATGYVGRISRQWSSIRGACWSMRPPVSPLGVYGLMVRLLEYL